LTTLPCFFVVVLAVEEELVVVPAGVLVVVEESEPVATFLPLSLITVVLLESERVASWPNIAAAVTSDTRTNFLIMHLSQAITWPNDKLID
jgi:hypothetical protein